MQTKRKKIIITVVTVVAVLLAVAAVGLGVYFGLFTSKGSAYSTPRIDLSVMPENVPDDLKYLYDVTVVDDGDGGESYLAHPDSILMPNAEGTETLYTFYVCGHGKGAIAVKSSADGGLTYSERQTNIPSSWAKSEETPTVYRLDFQSGETKYILISACPKWSGYTSGDGFCASVTDKDGNWSEFERFYGKNDSPHLNPIVAMSSLIHLKENGEYVDKWMGFFHDNNFKLYSTILTFENGNQMWSEPTEFLKNSYDANGKTIDQRLKAKGANLCELLVIRNDGGNGNVLCLIGRSNTKRINSLMAFSYDEGKTWTKLKEAPAELNGERHKAVYDGDRLFITFRSIERDPALLKKYKATTFVSEGWVAWVGTFDSLTDWYYNGESTGQYRLKLAHIYDEGQTSPDYVAGADTGYCGVTMVDGYIVVTTYGRALAGVDKTVIVSKRLKLADIDRLYEAYSAVQR